MSKMNDIERRIFNNLMNNQYGTIQHQIKMINVNRRLLMRNDLDLDQVHHLACALKKSTEMLGLRLVENKIVRRPSEFLLGR